MTTNEIRINDLRPKGLFFKDRLLVEGNYKGYDYDIYTRNNVPFIKLVIPKRKRKWFNYDDPNLREYTDFMLVDDDYIEVGKYAYRVIIIRLNPKNIKSVDDMLTFTFHLFSNIC